LISIIPIYITIVIDRIPNATIPMALVYFLLSPIRMANIFITVRVNAN